MNLILLRFQYAVEIGAYLAYVGHYERSKDRVIKRIKYEELRHMVSIRRYLRSRGLEPWAAFNLIYLVIGHTIRMTCKVTPLLILDGVAQIMEVFNIISYDYFAMCFKDNKLEFLKMMNQEKEHELYFSTFPKYGRK